LSYSGVNLREAEVVQFATGSDNTEQTKQS